MRTVHRPRATRPHESGVALLLTLFVVLIVAVVVLQLAVSTNAEYAVSTNQGVVARLDGAADVAFREARKALIDDADASSAGAGAGGLPGGLPGGADPSNPEGGQQDDADSLNDAWAIDQQTGLGDIDVRVHVEDENRKLDILALLSKDEDFARASFQRLVRVLDMMREFDGSERDLDAATAESIANGIRQWLEGTNRKGLPKAALLSDKPDTQFSLPLSIEELIFVDGIDDDLLFDQKSNGLSYPGLVSMLTVWTSLESGPVRNEPDPDPAAAGAAGTSGTSGASGAAGAGGAGAPPAPSGTGAAASPEAVGLPGKPKDLATTAGRSQGPKVNVNTAPPAVLRALVPNFDIPTDVIDAIIRFRNQLDEEKLQADREAGGGYGYGDTPAGVDPITLLVDRASIAPGEQSPPAKYFETVQDLDKIDEWKGFSNEDAKKQFLDLITTKSDVFSIWIAVRPNAGPGTIRGENVDAFGYATTLSGQLDPDDTPGGIVKRYRQVVWRRKMESETVLLPVVFWEERFDRKLTLVDYPIDPRTGRPRTR